MADLLVTKRNIGQDGIVCEIARFDQTVLFYEQGEFVSTHLRRPSDRPTAARAGEMGTTGNCCVEIPLHSKASGIQ